MEKTKRERKSRTWISMKNRIWFFPRGKNCPDVGGILIIGV
jgi:hypothetical protein